MTRDEGIEGHAGAASGFARLMQRLMAKAERLVRGDGYRPEKHYMRGSGPKSRGKETKAPGDGSGSGL